LSLFGKTFPKLTNIIDTLVQVPALICRSRDRKGIQIVKKNFPPAMPKGVMSEKYRPVKLKAKIKY